MFCCFLLVGEVWGILSSISMPFYLSKNLLIVRQAAKIDQNTAESI